MARFIALLCSVLFLVCNISSKSVQKTCSDCVNLFSCPPAVILFNENKTETNGQLVNSFCGFGDDKFPRVCCNELTDPAEDEDINNHPNLRLLPNNCGIYDGQRIVGGEKAGIHEFPWMALISYKTRDGIQFQCGGTLINDRYILTAAHCIHSLKIVGVRVGEYDIDTDVDCQGLAPDIVCESNIQDIRVEEAIEHEDYHGKPYVFNDIGLLRLKTPADFSHKNAAPLCLPITKELRSIDIGGKNATVTGWGATESGYASNTLLKVQLPVHTKDKCKSYYGRGRRPEDPDITENVYCAGEYGKDSCKGDSGGPLIVDGVYQSGQRYIQYGIVSNGPIRCGSDFPGVYTNVPKYMKWILDHIKP